MGLQFFDNLHGPDFRSAGDRPARKHRGQQVDVIVIRAQPPLDFCNKVMDLGIALQGEGLIDLHRAKLTDSTKVVAFEVDNHRQFSFILRTRKQFRLICRILLRRAATRACAFDRTCHHTVAFHSIKPFRTGTYDGFVGPFGIGCKWSGTDSGQIFIKGQWVACADGFESVCKVGLKDVAGFDVVEYPTDF